MEGHVGVLCHFCHFFRKSISAQEGSLDTPRLAQICFMGLSPHISELEIAHMNKKREFISRFLFHLSRIRTAGRRLRREAVGLELSRARGES